MCDQNPSLPVLFVELGWGKEKSMGKGQRKALYPPRATTMDTWTLSKPNVRALCFDKPRMLWAELSASFGGISKAVSLRGKKWE